MPLLAVSVEIDEAYYQTIIDNNIFRPLGWRPKAPSFPYQLIGTITYSSIKKKSTAVIQEKNVERKTHTVSIGDKFGDITVIDIQPKKVILDRTGKKITLRITQQFLNTPRSIPTQVAEIKNRTEHIAPLSIEVSSQNIEEDPGEDAEFTYEFRDDY